MFTKKEIRFTSKRENIHLVERFTEDICDAYNINNTYFGNIMLSLTEAVENAIIHGNKLNPQKTVTLAFHSKPKSLVFEVTDQGEGFDFLHLSDPTDINIPFNDNTGTGVFLMKALADKVVFLENGRKIQIYFDIASINREKAEERVNKLDEYYSTKKIEEKQKQRTN